MAELRARPKNRKERLQRLVGDIRDRTFAYQANPKPKRDWARYDEAQAHHIADILQLIKRLIDQQAEPPKKTSRGRPPRYATKDLAKAILLQTTFQTSNRVTSGLCRMFREKLRLERNIHYKAIERAYSSHHVLGLVLNAFEDTARFTSSTTERYTLDGSGIRTSIKDNWERQKSNEKAMADRFDGAITMVALPSQIITAFIPRKIGFSSEVDQLPRLVEKCVAVTDGLRGTVTADAGFQSRENCRVIEQAGGIPRIMPKRNVSLKTLGVPAWTQMLNALLRDPQGWLQEYHQRSLAETSWSIYGNLFPRPLRRLDPLRRTTEHASRFLVFNLVRLSRVYRQGNLPHLHHLIHGSLN